MPKMGGLRAYRGHFFILFIVKSNGSGGSTLNYSPLPSSSVFEMMPFFSLLLHPDLTSGTSGAEFDVGVDWRHI